MFDTSPIETLPVTPLKSGATTENGKEPLNTAGLCGDEEQYDRSLLKEAQRVCQEIAFGVQSANVSDQLDKSDALAYINLRTLEQEDWCVELTASGYLVVAKKFDTIDDVVKQENLDNLTTYETVEALMNHLSPLFVKKYNDSVAEKLKNLV